MGNRRFKPSFSSKLSIPVNRICISYNFSKFLNILRTYFPRMAYSPYHLSFFSIILQYFDKYVNIKQVKHMFKLVHSQSTIPSHTKINKNEKKFQEKPIQQISEADLEFLTLRQLILSSECFENVSRHERVKLKKWIQKLDQLSVDVLWKQIRQRYTKLLYLMCLCQVILQPFNQFPPKGQLQTLSFRDVCKVMKKVEAYVQKQNVENGICEHCREGIDKMMGRKEFGKDCSKSIQSKVEYLQDSHIQEICSEKSFKTTFESCNMDLKRQNNSQILKWAFLYEELSKKQVLIFNERNILEKLRQYVEKKRRTSKKKVDLEYNFNQQDISENISIENIRKSGFLSLQSPKKQISNHFSHQDIV